MPPSKTTYDLSADSPSSVVREQKFMIVRTCPVYASQHMVKCIDDDKGNGYCWSTTGSGNTLTSFKASTLLTESDSIHKCVFVVDRKDLDRQTQANTKARSREDPLEWAEVAVFSMPQGRMKDGYFRNLNQSCAR